MGSIQTCQLHQLVCTVNFFVLGHKMLGGEYEDGEETKSDFLARMLLMDRIEIDPTGKTMVSKTTCEKEGEGKTERKELVNPMLNCEKDDCSQFNVSAKGFFSVYKEKMETRILDGAKSLIFEVSDCKDINLKPSDPPVKNEANTDAEEWHHKYQVNFRVEARKDPKEYLKDYFEKNIKQMGDAAVKISYVETEELPK